MIVGVQKTGSGFEQRWPEFLRKHGAEVRMLDLARGDWIEQVRPCDAVMWHFHHDPFHHLLAPPLLRVIEQQHGKTVFPDQPAAWHFDNKIAQTHLLRSLGLPVPQTWIFWSRADALAWAGAADYPVVAKLSCGAGSSNVRLLRTPAEVRRWIGKMFSRAGIFPASAYPRGTSRALIALHGLLRFVRRCASVPAYVLGLSGTPLPRQYWMPQRDYALFQEFLPGNDCDTRVTIIGDRAFAYRRMNRPDDFRASGSGNFNTDPAQIDPRCIRLAFEASRKLGAQSTAFDFLFKGPQREPVIIEISYAYVSWVVESCPGHWDGKLNWHEGRMWPEEAHVLDLLARIRAREIPGTGMERG